jgi:hypothetical protein
MAARMSLSFAFIAIPPRPIGWVAVEDIAVVDTYARRPGDKALAWIPFGFWTWKPGAYLGAFGRDWEDHQRGTWYWQIEHPKRTHIRLVLDDEVIGSLSFNRGEYEMGNLSRGTWFINNERSASGKTTGDWQGWSETYRD